MKNLNQQQTSSLLYGTLKHCTGPACAPGVGRVWILLQDLGQARAEFDIFSPAQTEPTPCCCSRPEPE